MQASTAQRERLVSPLSLALMAGVFAVAFIVLKPDRVPGLASLDDNESLSVDTPVVDELGLAYLRAQRSSGALDNQAMVKAIERLMQAGRYTDAQLLLQDDPELPLPLPMRSRLDLERAARGSDSELYAQIQSMVVNRALSDDWVLPRAMELIERLPEPALQHKLFNAWALQANTRTQRFDRYLDCARTLQAGKATKLALDCIEQAEAVADNDSQRFTAGLMKLSLLPPGGEIHRAEIDRLFAFEKVQADALENFATRLLQQERPDMAYRIYARLALQQPERSHHWLPLASRWAEAAGKPEEAVVFLRVYAQTTPADILSDAQRQAVWQKVETLQLAAGQTRAAFRSVRSRLHDQAVQADTLRLGISLARQLGEISQALEWNTQLLELEPNDGEAARLQRDLAMAEGDLDQALRWARRVAERFPGSLVERERLARIAEWSGYPEEALAHWVWLAGQQASRFSGQLDGLASGTPLPAPSEQEPLIGAAKVEAGASVKAPSEAGEEPAVQSVAALQEVVRLARMTLRSGLAADSLRKIARWQSPSDRDIVEMMRLYDQNGESATASEALEEILLQHGPSRFALRTLAAHHMHHYRREQSLSAWQRYVSTYGPDVEAILAQTELLWRLDRKAEAAAMTDHLQGRTLLSSSSDYQIGLLAEIGWRYRKPWLTLLVRPHVQALELEDQRSRLAQRSLDLLVESGQDDIALDEALQLWASTANPEFAFTAMKLALTNGRIDVWQGFSPDSENGRQLKALPRYWALLAQHRLQQNNVEGAVAAYDSALAIDPLHLESISGLIWAAIGEQDQARLMQLLPRYRMLAEQTPSLWQAMAVGYLQLGAANVSLRWFDLLLDDIEADYAMLLTYADALEYAGRSATALKVRQYTLHRLRPLLVENSGEERELLLRQYTRLSNRYAGAETNEALYARLLSARKNMQAVRPAAGADAFWREDMAIAWLMATQQHEQARVIMADLHVQRMQSPAWQRLALALNDKDEAAVQAIVQSSGPLSVGNHILALRQLGHDRDAFTLAQQVLRPGAQERGSNLDDLAVAEDQYVALRNAHPSFVSGSLHSRSAGQLDIDQRGVRFRHSLPAQGVGLALDVQRRQLDSDRFLLSENDEQDDVALSLFFGGERRGGRVSTGFLRTGEDELVYGSAAFVQALGAREARVSAELAYNEATELSPELIVGARQHRLSVAYDADVGRHEFLRLEADATEINTRVQERRVARGLGGSVEFGVRGSFGSNQWSTSIRAAHLEHDRETSLPEELKLASDSTMDSVVAPKLQSLSLGAFLSRGGINADFPQVSTPRYFLSASVGQNWPDRVLGFQLGAGAGIRVLGGDELSFSLQHDTQSTTRRSGDNTSVGVSYRYHFQ